MSGAAKRILTAVLSPFARLDAQVSGPLGRLWAHARLSAKVGGVLDSSVVVLGAPEVHGSGRISFGRNLYLYRDLYFETRGGGEIKIGDGVVISRGVHVVAFSNVTIGEGSMVGEYVSIRDANHRFGGGASLRTSGHEASPVIIGRNVWVGRGVTILPGVRIGDNAVVGANAVVTRDVPAGQVVVGVPARAIEERRAA